MRLGDEPKLVSVTVEAPGLTVSHDFDARHVMRIKQLVCYLARRVLSSSASEPNHGFLYGGVVFRPEVPFDQ